MTITINANGRQTRLFSKDGFVSGLKYSKSVRDLVPFLKLPLRFAGHIQIGSYAM